MEHGFRATSMAMLTDASGLGKQSLYNALGDKEAAYLQSIDCAVARNAAMEESMRSAPDGRSAVHQFFSAVVACPSDVPATNVCIVTAGLIEGVEAEAIAAKLREKWLELCGLLERTVERGQNDGSIRTDVAAGDMCAMLVTLLAGARVASRAPTDRDALRSTVDWVLQLLDTGAPHPLAVRATVASTAPACPGERS